jgi:hypothetical protein
VVPNLNRFERFTVFHTSTSGGGHDFAVKRDNEEKNKENNFY